MASEITDQDNKLSPSHDDGVGNGAGLADSRGVKRARQAAADDDDDEDGATGRERRKIEIKFITDKSRRHITFSKRKAGIMKKAYELSVLTGTQVLLLVVSETGLVYTFTTPKLQPLVTKPEGKNLIQACLNAPEPANANENGLEGESQVDSPEENPHAQAPRGGMGAAPMQQYPNMGQNMSAEQALQYNQYLRAGQAGATQYPMPPHMAPQPHAQ
ncbi:SRF-TF-domain-containing protein [Microthyrium microscopicum]|uniref:SRF-TF-domain-containing protein n=1 Tax=Microthyrium microscopicum TaxID=703497 RepID=A0A6A6UC10_9PEZI|nr:SRF-TF-domain-containing protein [Microthyrium microscopicum]